ncbi:major facilitator superfamily MFS_1 [Rhodoferax ferrireducens T118]|uniref:Major facilitator superfamily MFS_1 n=1 Tax=Albidiferax ferrireducens (strain ATCC BAA-621 / DSM 15236 / T118) TaxID=338969 RepID=Q221T4_ALBFT|nr:MFS transporter [Rhodoferax ferrireducens]ABD68219.1 major facilitator superfamily MFS_1 [Rhodoferax ferrireducens T118]
MQAPPPINLRLVGWLSLAQLISWGSIFYTFALVMAPVERDLGLSRAESSLAFSLALLVEGLLAYPVGRWIDRGHERIVMTGGSVLAGVCLLLQGSVTGMVGFYAVWAGLGAAMAAVLYAPAFAVVTRRFPLDFRRAIILMTFLGGLASTVFIPLTAWLMALWGWRHAFIALAALHLLVCAPLHALALRGAPRPSPRVAAADPQTVKGVTDFIFSAPFLLIGVFVVLLMAVTVALPAHMVSLLRENGLREVWVIAIPAGIGVIQVLGRLLLYFFEHHVDPHLANRLIPCLIPLGLLALLAAPLSADGQVGAVLLFVLLYGLGNGMLTIVKGTAIAQYVNRDHVATLNGALGLPLALARAAAPLLLGLLWTAQAGYTHGLWLLLALSVLGVGALMLAQQLALRSR